MNTNPRKYKGLANVGATCYMNSLLQTLFMTPEFRTLIYSWKYDPLKHGNQEDSILFQMQKLFARLQSDFPSDVDPKGLIRSFQWGGEEALEQQDIQQFNRVLFQALQQSLRMSEQGVVQHQLLTELFQGIMMNYSKCKECGKEYPREERFQDLILTVKDKYQRVYNKSLEVGLQRYIKPETLSGTNQYFCDNCDKKVDAERGVKLLKLPRFLPVILRRFSFDLMTMERIKLNDEVSFPFVINMNNYMQGYEDIPVKEVEEILEEEVVFPLEPKKPMVIKRSFLKAGKKDVRLPNNIKNKPFAETKSFLTDMRKKTGKNKEITIQIESGSKMMSGVALEEELMEAAIAESLLENGCQSRDPVASLDKPQQSLDPQCLSSLPPPSSLPTPPSPPTTEPDVTGLPPKILPQPQTQTPNLLKQTQKKTSGRSDQQQRVQFDQALKQYQQQVSQLKQKYSKDGSWVYELYSILIHSGGVNHGHYYAYIRSFQDGKWYCFNDFTVKEVNIGSIRQQTFGGKGSTNTYVLYYRHVDQENKSLQTPEPPKQIMEVVNKEKTVIINKQVQRTRDADKYVKLKIYYQLYTKPLEIINTSTLKQCLEAAKKLFGHQLFMEIPEGSIRLRMFNPVTESKLQTFTGEEQSTLSQLKINSHKSLLLEVKKPEQVFDQYSVGLTSIRIVWWSEEVTSLEEPLLKLHTVSFPPNSTMNEIDTKIKQVSGTMQPICIVKRHQNDQFCYHEVVNTEAYGQKTMQDLMIFENEILFVQLDSQSLMWPSRFQSENFRVCLRYILSKQEGVVNSITVDSRDKLSHLKAQLCHRHGLDANQTILRRGNKSGIQLKDLDQTLQDQRFISGTQLYLDNGIPALPGELRVILYLSKPTPLDTLNAFSTFEEICDIPVNGNLKASEFKERFLQVLLKKTGTLLDPSRTRIRQRLSQKMTKVYRQKPMRQQQLIQKRMIAIEQIPFPEDLDPKENLVYIRVFDPSQWTLGDRFQIVVNKMMTMDEMAKQISKRHPELAVQNMEISKVIALYKLSMLDLVEMEYYCMHSIQIPVSIEPLFVNNDGIVFVVKDKTKKLRDLTKEEQIVFGGSVKTAGRGKTSTYKPPQGKKQKGVTITVKKLDPKAQSSTQSDNRTPQTNLAPETEGTRIQPNPLHQT